MRRLFVLGPAVLGFALGIVACGGGDANGPPPQPPPPPPPPPVAAATVDPAPAPPPEAAAPVMSQTDKELMTLKTLGDALGSHDTKAMGAVFTPDAVFKSAGMPDQTRDQYLAHEDEHNASFPDGKVGARRVFLKNDVAVVEWTRTGTNTGPGPMGAKSTGKTVGINGVTVLWFTPDGLIKEQHQYVDVPTLVAQLGLGPANMHGRPPASLPDGKAELHVSKNTPDEEKNLANAQAIQKAFETHDTKAFAASSADDVAWDDVSAPAPMNGKKAMVGYFTMVTKAIPDLKMTCNTWPVDDFVIEECTMAGTNKGALVMPGKTVPATNKPVSLHGVDVIQMKDGKAVKGNSYGNGMEMATQLGLVHEPKDGKAHDLGKGDAPKPKDATPKTPAK